MEKVNLAIIFLVLAIAFLYFFKPQITGLFIGFGEPTNATWFNTTWHYRIRIDIYSPTNRTNWPVEIKINFTDLLPSGTFDENSLRLFEYSSDGRLLYEVPVQFDKDDNYNAAYNAIGTIVFILNGTTLQGQNRTFYLYYDSIENGQKESKTYETNLTYYVDSSGRIINVNTTELAVYIDTFRQNYSGIYHVVRKLDDINIVNVDETQKPIEYTELFNGTNTLTFDLRNTSNNVLIIPGPVRVTLIQRGYEIDSNSLSPTNEAFLEKRYYFYNKAGDTFSSFIKVEGKIYNLKGQSINRSSTPAGAIALDLNRSLLLDPSVVRENQQNPYSYVLAGTTSYNWAGGLINLNSYSSFYAKNETETLGRVGLHLEETQIQPNGYINFSSILFFGAFGDIMPGTIFENVRRAASNPEVISISKPEKIFVNVSIKTNATIYNRNEYVLLEVNITNDPYQLAKYLNATIDFGTLDKSDDLTIQLFDDGTHGDKQANDKIYTNYFLIPTNAQTGTWKINVSIYDKDFVFLDSHEYSFEVTNIFNANVSVLNKILMEGLTNFAIVNVKNYRNDSFIPGAFINCSYGSYYTTNFTDYGNGTYLVNFTSPPYGNYILVCNASKDGNYGIGQDTFFSQAAKTQVKIEPIPSSVVLANVSYYYGETFGFYVNASNIGYGIAYSANISFEVPSGWSYPSEPNSCGNIGLGEFCYKYFTITAPQNTIGNFSVNITIRWGNPDGTISTNETQINVTILPNPILNILEQSITTKAKDGLLTFLTNFTISSEGNYPLENIQISCIESICQDFNISFSPSSISSLPQGQKINVSITSQIPLGYPAGSYKLTINASTNYSYDTFNLTVVLDPKTNVSIDLDRYSFITSTITQYSGDSFVFSSTVKNILNTSARDVNITLSLPSGWSSNSSLESCGDLRSGETCIKSFNVSIPAKTPTGTYNVFVYVYWKNLDNSVSSNSTTIQVAVLSNPLLDVFENNLSKKVEPSKNSYIGNFTVLSIGNDRLYNIRFSCVEGKCDDFNFIFTPNLISSLEAGTNYSVALNVSIPFNYLAGSYQSLINVTSDNSKNYDTLLVIINVSENRTWDIYPIECKKSEFPTEGIACELNVYNLGNANITFSISPEYGNYTKVNETSFVIEANKTKKVSIFYNVTGVPEGVYNSTFTISALEDDANPKNKTFYVTLLPYSPPEIQIYFDKDEIEQTRNVRIFANVTDKSGTGIKSVNVSVLQPNGSIYTSQMAFLTSDGNVSIFYADYPFVSGGSTYDVGIYNVTVTAEDNVGNIGNNTSSFKVRRSFVAIVSTFSDKYYQGDTGSIYFLARDFEGNPIKDVKVSFEIYNPQGVLIFKSQNYTTNDDGTILPPPSFYLPSDSIVGNYTLIANAVLELGDIITTKNASYNFSVLLRSITVTGLFADISTSVVWYPNNIMKFGILVYNGEGKPVDPDSMNLTVYDPAGNVYLSVSLAQMNRESIGFYSYRYAMPVNTPSGMYLAVLNVSKGDFNTMRLTSFRVAMGGPYDLKVIPLQYEVAQGEELPFNILVINMGEVSQDVFIEYWVSSVDGRNYFYSSEAVYTPSLANKTFLRTAYIFSDQPLGTYFINVKMTYDYVQPPILANATFLVVARNVTQVTRPIQQVPIPTGQIILPTPLPIPTANLTASILIEKFNPNISLARNSIKTELVTVRNTGSLDLSNVSLMLVGFPVSWFNITPSNYYSLVPNATAVFAITFNVPKEVSIGNYVATLVASSNLISDSKQINIIIYRSIRELLEEEISKLEYELAQLVIDTKIAEKEGKDVSVVKDMINSIRDEIIKARDNLSKENYEGAMKNVENAKILLERARDLLSKLTVKARAFVIPFWLIAAIAISILAIASTVLILRKKKKEGEKIRLPTFLPAVKLAEQIRKKPSKEEILAEKENVLRALRALEKSREEGLISEAAYRAMKKSLEEKLEKIEKKL